MYKLKLRLLDEDYDVIKESIVAEHDSIELMQSELNKRQIPRTVDELMIDSYRRENSFNEYFVTNQQTGMYMIVIYDIIINVRNNKRKIKIKEVQNYGNG